MGSLPCINDVLSHHLLIEVLVRIPLKDAFRSRSVCKLWLSTLHDDPHYVAGFVQHRISEPNSNNDDHQELMNVQWHHSEMLLVKSSDNALTASQFSLDFLPFHDESTSPHRRISIREIVGSSNGLILFSPIKKTTCVEYYICNPLTKQWLALPSPPGRHLLDVQVGFICDPFYNRNVNNGSVALNDEFGMKVVHLYYGLVNVETNRPERMDVEVFSSQTGTWTTSKVQLPNGVRFKTDPGPLVPHKGRLYWLVEQCDILIYDPEQNEFLLERHDPPREALYTFGYWVRQLATFRGLSLCRGSFCIGQAWNARLRVFMLSVDDGKWRLKHDVDLYNEMQCSSSTVRQKVRFYPESMVFWTMHPDDSMVAYLTLDSVILECNFRYKTMKVMSDRHDNRYEGVNSMLLGWSNVVTCSLPLWPTPLPATPNCLKKVGFNSIDESN